MPTFDYRCANRHMQTKFFRVKDYVEAVDCEQCDLAAVRVFTPITVAVRADCSYDSPIDGRPITTRHARLEDMKRNNCIEYDPEMKKDCARRQRERDAAMDSAVEETVCREIAKMPKRKKAQLIKEVVHQGVSADVVRR